MPDVPMQGFKQRTRAALAAAGTPQEMKGLEGAFTDAAYQHVLFLSTFTGFVAQAPLQLQHLQRCAGCWAACLAFLAGSLWHCSCMLLRLFHKQLPMRSTATLHVTLCICQSMSCVPVASCRCVPAGQGRT